MLSLQKRHFEMYLFIDVGQWIHPYNYIFILFFSEFFFIGIYLFTYLLI